MRKLINLKPERVFYYFEEISKIPRESGNEKAISDFLVKTAKKLGLEVYQDKILNVIIRKPATKDYESSEGVIIQGHIDMVCEKTTESNHNFLTDSLNLVIDNGYLRAENTTLGADNGIAIAMGLAILEDKNIEHPAIELLATIEEETTMKGALNLEKNLLNGKYLINIDSEEEGILTAGSAGGLGIFLTFTDKRVEINNSEYDFFEIVLDNLAGGHSGIEIDKKRLNANKLIAKILTDLKKSFDIKLVAINGGSKDNAIPRKATSTIAVKKENSPKFLEFIPNFLENTIKTFKDVSFEKDKNLTLTCEKATKILNLKTMFTDELFENYLNFINDCPTGVNTWLEEYPDIVESSNNLAIIKTENESIKVIISVRSSDLNTLSDLKNKILQLSEKYKSTADISKGYPEWKFKKDSLLRTTATKTYKDLFNTEMSVTVIHAGLECGAIAKNYPDLDMISIGPNIYDVHTPKEKMEVKSVEKYYNYLVELLKNLK